MTAQADQGWSGYYDQTTGIGDMGELGDMGYLGSLDYKPYLGPVGSGPAYFPGDVSQDAAALNYLGFLSDNDLSQLSPSTGSQRGDIDNAAGAWDPRLQDAATGFQLSVGLTPDGWIGPNTRTKLAAAVQVKNAQSSPIAPPFMPTPPGLAPIGPPPPQPGYTPINPVPTQPGASPMATVQKNKTLLYAGGAALALGAVYFLFLRK